MKINKNKIIIGLLDNLIWILLLISFHFFQLYSALFPQQNLQIFLFTRPFGCHGRWAKFHPPYREF